VNCRGYSKALQRVITDFGADVPFGQIAQKLQEHHGISVPTSTAQGITESHAQKMLKSQSLKTEVPIGAAIACLITEIDGSMIPIVETDKSESGTEKIDGRKTRKLSWKEARLTSARTPEQEIPIFGATVGSTDQAGAQLVDIAIRSGLGVETFVHTVGDGAPWIAAQVNERFGEPGRYLLDFYHVCEYLAAASHVCAPINPSSWIEEQKTRLKANLSDLVLEELILEQVIAICSIDLINLIIRALSLRVYLLAQEKLRVLIAMLYYSKQVKTFRMLVDYRKCWGNVSP
jgi:hypothetical protein